MRTIRIGMIVDLGQGTKMSMETEIVIENDANVREEAMKAIRVLDEIKIGASEAENG